MYGLAASAGLPYEKYVKKFEFFSRSKFTFLVLYYQDVHSQKILFLNIKGYDLGEKLKKRTHKMS